MLKTFNIYEIDKLLDESTYAASTMDVVPFNARLSSSKGFDILALILLRIHLLCTFYTTYPDDFTNPESIQSFEIKYLKVIGKLIQRGAFIDNLRFEEYRDFIQQLVISVQTPTYSTLLEEGVTHHNLHISRIAKLLKDPDQYIFKEDILPDLLEHARDLVQRKPKIEQLWLPVREKYLNEYVNSIVAAFKTPSEKQNSELKLSNTRFLGGELQIIVLVAEYLMSAPAIFDNQTSSPKT